MKTEFPIIVVDDDKISRTIIEKHLKESGFSVVTAANGNQALAYFDQGFFPIVVTDWMMPGMDGLQLCRCIRDKETDGYVYIIMVTARDSKRDVVSGLESGADDYLTKPINPAELVARVQSANRILKLEKSLRKAHADIKRLSIIDQLTGCYNRSHLDERLPYELAYAKRYSHSLSLIFADIDHFKHVNDTYGHQVGDEVLKFFARCVHEQLRKNIDWVVRYGGEEFLIVLPETKHQGAFKTAERLRVTLAKEVITINSDAIQITASFGGASYDFHKARGVDISMQRLIEIADAQLYHSKQNGRNQVCIADLKTALG